MTFLFHDILNNPELERDLRESRILGTEFDEILYADDTTLASTNPQVINAYIKHIEREGANIGLKVNYKKTELLRFGADQICKW